MKAESSPYLRQMLASTIRAAVKLVCVLGEGGGGLCISVCVLIFALSLLPPCECEAACLCIVDPFTVRALVFFGYCALAAQDVNSLFLYRQHLQKPNIKS